MFSRRIIKTLPIIFQDAMHIFSRHIHVCFKTFFQDDGYYQDVLSRRSVTCFVHVSWNDVLKFQMTSWKFTSCVLKNGHNVLKNRGKPSRRTFKTSFQDAKHGFLRHHKISYIRRSESTRPSSIRYSIVWYSIELNYTKLDYIMKYYILLN